MVTFGYIDIVIIVALSAGLILGLIFGFSKKHLTSFASECAYLVAYFFGGSLSRILAGTDLSYYIQHGYQSLLPTTEAFTQVISSDYTTKTTQLSTALSEMHIPTFFQGFFVNRITDTTSTVSAAIASSFAYFTIIIATFAILFIAVFLLIKLIFSPLWSDGSIFGEKGRSFFGRICGALHNVCKFSLILLGVMFVLTFVNQMMLRFNVSSLNDFLVQDLNLNNADAFSLGKLIYNTMSSLLGWISLNGIKLP